MADEELRRIFTSNLNYYLYQNGYKQADLARHMGVSTTTVAKWCTGQAMPRIDKIQSICNWLGITKEDLLNDRTAPKENYFINKEARDLADYMRNNPGHRVVMDAIRKVADEDLSLILDLANRLAQNNNDF